EIVDVAAVRGRLARPGAAPDLIFEIPHGATETADYARLAARLTSPLPDGLIDFFHVNTDAGAPELAVAIADRVVTDLPELSVAIVRCRVPRTFIDCNRRIDADAAAFKAGKVTPGLMPWITTAADRDLLRAAYDQYVATIDAVQAVLAPGGALVMLHSYAPRTVDVEVDDQIVVNLRRAYQPEVEPTWPLRPEVDLVGREPDGTDRTPGAVVETLREELARRGVSLADGVTYPLHPSTLAHGRVLALPGRALCVEVRRDLLAEPFAPFAQMHIGPAKLERLAAPFATAIRRWWP
ncbi:MAG TPA: N-formylglutamate amidohydrolase, partial [Kofleriaceae bacterium]